MNLLFIILIIIFLIFLSKNNKIKYEGFENEKLPKLRFIGVGPDPGQIITELPSTLDLIKGN